MFPLPLCLVLFALSSRSLAAADGDDETSLLQTHRSSEAAHTKPDETAEVGPIQTIHTTDELKSRLASVDAEASSTWVLLDDVPKPDVATSTGMRSMRQIVGHRMHMSSGVFITIATFGFFVMLLLALRCAGLPLLWVRAKERLFELLDGEEVPLRKHVELDASQG